MKILLTFFDPFGNEDTNSVLEVSKLIESQIDGHSITKLTLPTVFFEASALAIKKARELMPDAIIMLGQASGRGEVTPERVAINVMDAKIPDNKGNCPIDQVIIDGAPNAYFSNLPIKKIVESLKSMNIPASVSNTAGTFVCNQTMYSLLDFAAKELPRAKVGFIHLPATPKQAEGKSIPSMETPLAADAVRQIIRVVAESV